MSEKDTLAPRVEGRERGACSGGDGGDRAKGFALFRSADGAVNSSLCHKRPNLTVVFLYSPVLEQDQINFILISFSILKTKQKPLNQQ